MVWSVTGVKS